MTTSTLIASDYEKFDRSEEHLRIEPSIVISGKLFLGIEDHSLDENTQGTGRYVHIDADKVRDAIDKAVGKREEEADWRDSDRVEVDGIEGRIIVGRETVGKYAGQWAFPSGLHFGDGAVARLNPKAVPASASKPYRPIDRDRLLRHIEDLEATLTRRNERHEQDQERIRELEAERARLEAEVFRDYTAHEHLKLAWEAAVVPEDGVIRAGEEYVLQGISGRVEGPLIAPKDRPHRDISGFSESRLLEPRPESSKEDSYRKELEDKGLAEWEIELLVGAAE